MHIRKARAGSIPGHTWEHDGAVVEVENALAEQLLLIPGGGFSIAEVPKMEEPQPEPAEPETAQNFDEVFDKGEPVEVASDTEETRTLQRKPTGRPRLPRNEHGQIIRK